VVVLVAVAGLAALGVTAVLARRRRRRGVPPDGPDGWWTELESRLAAYDVTWSDATTPRQAAGLVEEWYAEHLRHGVAASSVEDARAALAQLVEAVENARYAPVALTWRSELLERLVDAAVLPFHEAA